MGGAAAIFGFERRFTTVGNVRLHHWIGGPSEGAPVLLWHGFLSTAWSWRDVAPRLAEAGMRVLVPDMRGFGDSDKPSGNTGYDAAALAEEFRALVSAIGFGDGRPLVIAAHDMGAPPALLWGAHHPDEIAALLYIEAPVMLQAVLGRVIAYEREPMANGSMWWWILPLAPGVPERMIVGNERAFLTWFYEGATARPEVFDEATVAEYMRTFRGADGVLGALGVYRTAFDSIDQTEPLRISPIAVPVIALGGARGLGMKVGQGVRLVARAVTEEVVEDCGHFMPEERPDVVIRHILSAVAHQSAGS